MLGKNFRNFEKENLFSSVTTNIKTQKFVTIHFH